MPNILSAVFVVETKHKSVAVLVLEIRTMENKVQLKKRYKCGQCDYSASLAGALKRHIMAIHDKVKRYKCELCEYAASLAGNLKQHVLRVHQRVKKFEL